jgi:hypothetical protein
MIPKFLFVATAALAAILWTQPGEASVCSLTGLAWIAGTWRDVSDPERSQERWVAAPDHVLMGTAWEFPKGKAGYAELMTLRPSGNAVSMYLRHFDGALSKAWEEREAPMVFEAASCENASAVFEGRDDHAGERLSYSRAGNRLTIIGNFLHQGKPVRMEWHMRRGPD